MKNHSVISKYINPDRFIKKLKGELAWRAFQNENLIRVNNELRKERDELKSIETSKEWFEMSGGEAISINITNPKSLEILRTAKLGQNVIGLGEIYEIQQSTFSKEAIKFLIKSVRIVPEGL